MATKSDKNLEDFKINTIDDLKGNVFLRNKLSRQAFIVLELLDPKHEGHAVATNFAISYLLVEAALTTQETSFQNRAVTTCVCVCVCVWERENC
jgi:hypothetical protein